MGQKVLQNRALFLQLGKVSRQPDLPGLGNVLLPVPVGHKGVPVVEAVVAGTGVLRALPAKRNAAVLQGAPGDGAALVARSAAAAGTEAAQVHGAEATVEAAEGEEGLFSGKTFHGILLTGCRMTVFSFSGLHRRTSLK